MRSKNVDFSSWLELQMWRSDGSPAAHGTFALIAINLKLKKGLLQQGHYALNTSGIDVSTTAQEILQAGDEDILQKQMTRVKLPVAENLQQMMVRMGKLLMEMRMLNKMKMKRCKQRLSRM